MKVVLSIKYVLQHASSIETENYKHLKCIYKWILVSYKPQKGSILNKKACQKHENAHEILKVETPLRCICKQFELLKEEYKFRGKLKSGGASISMI